MRLFSYLNNIETMLKHENISKILEISEININHKISKLYSHYQYVI